MKIGNFREILGVAWRELKSHKFRSFLTVLGVTIGVLAVISIAAIIHGLNTSVMDRVAALGSKGYFATTRVGGPRFRRQMEEERQRKEFTYEDVLALRRHLTLTKVVSPFMAARSAFGDRYIVKHREQRAENPFIRGVEANFPEAVGTVIVKEGRFFTPVESDRAVRVAVLGDGIARSLFPVEDPIGREIRINGIPFGIIGVLEHQKGLFGGFSEDNFVLVPFGTFHKQWPEVKEITIAFAVDDPGRLEAAMNETEYVLRKVRKLPHSKPNDFEMFTANFLVDLWNQLTFVLFVITIVVASIGLMVGGIGVMNIMLVSVKERTREIGVRMAMGARRRDILLQFVTEAVTLTTVGGVAGIACSALLVLGINLAVPGLPARISTFWTALGMGVSVLVGLTFGIWPAVKASRLDPIECLHYE
ncbi:MAG: ABC transporter permease [Acidobacteria bacterium]|nr:ABC transporter permease [Acidobacteriota bacterium]